MAKVTDKTLRATRTREYPDEVWYFLACFIGTLAIFNWGSWAISKLSSKLSKKSAMDAEGGAGATNQRISLRRIPSAIANAYRVIAFRWTLQIGNSYTLNMAEVFVTCAYIIAIFVWEFINTTDLEGEKLDYSFWGNRAGTIASSQLPLITALGTKNNVVSYITGVSYDKLNYVHRMTARVIFVLLWVHTGNKYATYTPSEYPSYFVPIGLAAMVAFSILCVVSLRPIRSNAYEFFFLTHFFMVLVFLLGGYFHAREQQWGMLIWPSFLVWGLDRFIRFVRVVVFNHLYFLFFWKKNSNLDATAELLSPNFVRLRISRPSHFHWSPGQTAYLLMPTVSRIPTEAHPFTIASVDTAHGAEMDAEKKEGLGESAPYWKELVFLINVRDGFTKRLARVAEKGQKMKVLVDGPYGFTPSFCNDDTVVLVAGGSGVSFTLSKFLGLVNDVRNGTSVCRKVVWIWAIRDARQIEWVNNTLVQALQVAPSHLSVHILIYVTSPESSLTKAWDDDSAHSGSDGTPSIQGEKPSGPPSLLEFPVVHLSHGRPDIQALLQEEAAVNTGHMSVTVCGSQAIARSCRAALRFAVAGPMNILKGGPSVVLHVESFGYA
ncbi:hypothetical protein AcV5_003008 [Taiwanofungus camphoratus]|nr:hypothetical protein AcV5_003008 [Antrodia cinnamomea]